MRFTEYYIKEDETSTEIKPITSLSTDVKGEEPEFHNRLKQLLNIKFAEVGKHIRELTRPASKGQRKGLLIFVPGAANKIYQIDDEFVKFIVRDIYDHYRDITRGISWQVHMNWLFGGDIMMELMKELNPTIKHLYNEKERMKKEASDESMKTFDARNKYYIFSLLQLKNPRSFFHPSNPITKPLWEKLQPVLDKIKKEHPRVQEDKILDFLDNNRGYDIYKIKEEVKKTINDFLETLPEYKKLEDEHTKLRDKESELAKQFDAKIQEEVSKVNYPVLKKEIDTMVSKFVQMIANSIVTGTIKENYTI